jgi:hypothetical protein
VPLPIKLSGLRTRVRDQGRAPLGGSFASIGGKSLCRKINHAILSKINTPRRMIAKIIIRSARPGRTGVGVLVLRCGITGAIDWPTVGVTPVGTSVSDGWAVDDGSVDGVGDGLVAGDEAGGGIEPGVGVGMEVGNGEGVDDGVGDGVSDGVGVGVGLQSRIHSLIACAFLIMVREARLEITNSIRTSAPTIERRRVKSTDFLFCFCSGLSDRPGACFFSCMCNVPFRTAQPGRAMPYLN